MGENEGVTVGTGERVGFGDASGVLVGGTTVGDGVTLGVVVAVCVGRGVGSVPLGVGVMFV